MTQENEDSKEYAIVLRASEIEQVLYEMYTGSEFAPGDLLMTYVAQIAPSGWVNECCRGAAKTQAGNAVQYMRGQKTKAQLIEDLILGKVTPMVISEVMELADLTRGEIQ